MRPIEVGDELATTESGKQVELSSLAAMNVQRPHTGTWVGPVAELDRATPVRQRGSDPNAGDWRPGRRRYRGRCAWQTPARRSRSASATAGQSAHMTFSAQA